MFNLFKTKKMFKKKGFALVMSLVVLMALTTMSIAMLGVMRGQSINSVRSHQNVTAIHAAEFSIESGRLWLQDQLTITGTNPLIVRNTLNTSVSGDCLALHGYTNTSNQVYYARRKINQNFATATHTDFTRYKFEYYVQRIGYHTTINKFNYMPQSTIAPDAATAGVFTEKRIFYRVIGCGYGPSSGDQIVPMQGYYSAGGDNPAPGSGQTSTNLNARELKTEGIFRP